MKSESCVPISQLMTDFWLTGGALSVSFCFCFFIFFSYMVTFKLADSI